MTNENPVIFYNDSNSVQVQPIVDQPAAILPAAILPVNTEEEQLNTETISQTRRINSTNFESFTIFSTLWFLQIFLSY